MKRGLPPFRIRKQATNLWLASDIDSSGMSVFWTCILNADDFKSWDDAASMLARAQERYPRESMEIVPESHEGD